MFYGPMPLPVVVIMVVSFLGYLYKRRKKRVSNRAAYRVYENTVERKNMDAVSEVVQAHSDCTAEVVSVFVKGRHRVRDFRLLDPGDEVRLTLDGDEVRLYAFDTFLCTLILPDDSHIPQVIADGIHFDAYLGGRNLSMSYDNESDFASIIVFYKLDGLPPTKVNLQ